MSEQQEKENDILRSERLGKELQIIEEKERQRREENRKRNDYDGRSKEDRPETPHTTDSMLYAGNNNRVTDKEVGHVTDADNRNLHVPPSTVDRRVARDIDDVTRPTQRHDVDRLVNSDVSSPRTAEQLYTDGNAVDQTADRNLHGPSSTPTQGQKVVRINEDANSSRTSPRSLARDNNRQTPHPNVRESNTTTKLANHVSDKVDQKTGNTSTSTVVRKVF